MDQTQAAYVQYRPQIVTLLYLPHHAGELGFLGGGLGQDSRRKTQDVCLINPELRDFWPPALLFARIVLTLQVEQQQNHGAEGEYFHRRAGRVG